MIAAVRQPLGVRCLPLAGVLRSGDPSPLRGTEGNWGQGSREWFIPRGVERRRIEEQLEDPVFPHYEGADRNPSLSALGAARHLDPGLVGGLDRLEVDFASLLVQSDNNGRTGFELAQ